MENHVEKYYNWLAAIAGVLGATIAIIVGIALIILSENESRRHFGRVLAKWGIVGTILGLVIYHFRG